MKYNKILLKLLAFGILCKTFFTILTLGTQKADEKACNEVVKENSRINDSTENIQYIDEIDDGTKDNYKNQNTRIIAMASLGRSGTTLFGDLLRSIPGSVYFFEPLNKRVYDCSNQIECIQNLFESLLNCNYSSNLAKSEFLLSRFYMEDKNCTPSKCGSTFYKNLCLDSKNRIIKTIRTPVYFMEKLLLDSKYNYKLIYLVRDPRGSLNSVKRIGWKHDPDGECNNILNDYLKSYHYSSLYPTKLKIIQYEQLANDPYTVTKSLVKFLYGSSSIPEATKKFIDTHITITTPVKIKSQMQTVRNGNSSYDLWRIKIKENYWNDIETNQYCRTVISLLRYKLFNSYEDMRNRDVSIFNEL